MPYEHLTSFSTGCYVTNGGSQSLSVFDFAAGALSRRRTILLPSAPLSVAVTETPSRNEFVYVGTAGGFSGSSILQYQADGSGNLRKGSTFKEGKVGAFYALAPHRSGTHLYAAAGAIFTGGSINEFRINDDDGSLELIGSASLGLFLASDLTIDDSSEHAYATSNYVKLPAVTDGYNIPGLDAVSGSPFGSGVNAVSVRTATGPSK